MYKLVWIAAVIMVLTSPATAKENSSYVSFGYAFAHYLEEGGGNVPLGIYISTSTSGKTLGIEADVAYHRDSEWYGDVNTITGCVGPKLQFGSEKVNQYFHVLGGIRYDSWEGSSNHSFGGMLGSGMDIPVGPTICLHFGADFQIFFDEGENLKVLRLIVGLAF